MPSFNDRPFWKTSKRSRFEEADDSTADERHKPKGKAKGKVKDSGRPIGRRGRFRLHYRHCAARSH